MQNNKWIIGDLTFIDWMMKLFWKNVKNCGWHSNDLAANRRLGNRAITVRCVVDILYGVMRADADEIESVAKYLSEMLLAKVSDWQLQ
jgi:hypothetical protein